MHSPPNPNSYNQTGRGYGDANISSTANVIQYIPSVDQLMEQVPIQQSRFGVGESPKSTYHPQSLYSQPHQQNFVLSASDMMQNSRAFGTSSRHTSPIVRSSPTVEPHGSIRSNSFSSGQSFNSVGHAYQHPPQHQPQQSYQNQFIPQQSQQSYQHIPQQQSQQTYQYLGSNQNYSNILHSSPKSVVNSNESNVLYNFRDVNSGSTALDSSRPLQFHDTSPSNTNSKQPRKDKKRKANTQSVQPPTAPQTQESCMFSSFHVEENFSEDVTEAVAASGAKLFPIACVACRQRHKRCDRNIPSCHSCASKGISCQYRTPRKKGRALRTNQPIEAYISLDSIKYIPQNNVEQAETDPITSSSSSSSSHASMPTCNISPKVESTNQASVNNGRKKQKLSDSLPELSQSNLPAINHINSILHNGSTTFVKQGDAQLSAPNLSQQMLQNDTFNYSSITNTNPSTNFTDTNVSPHWDISKITSNRLDGTSKKQPFSEDAVLSLLSDPKSSSTSISQLISLLVGNYDPNFVFNLLNGFLTTNDANNVKDVFNQSFGLESFTNANEKLNIDVCKRKSIDYYDEVISLGYPIVNTSIMEEAIFRIDNSYRGYGPDQLALVYAIYAVICQRFSDPDHAKQAYHKSLLSLNETKEKNSVLVAGAYGNLAMYCTGTGDVVTANNFLRCIDLYFSKRRKEACGINSNEVILSCIGCDENSSASVFNYLTEAEFKVEKLKIVSSLCTYLGSGALNGYDFFTLKGYEFKEEIGKFMAECCLLFEGKVTKKYLDILTQKLTTANLSDYLHISNHIEQIYFAHEALRDFTKYQRELANTLMNIFVSGIRVWILHQAGIKGPVIEAGAKKISTNTLDGGYLLLHNITIQFIAMATLVHIEMVEDMQNGLRQRDDFAEICKYLEIDYYALSAMAKKYPRVELLYSHILTRAGNLLKVVGSEVKQFLMNEPFKQFEPRFNENAVFDFEACLQRFIQASNK